MLWSWCSRNKTGDFTKEFKVEGLNHGASLGHRSVWNNDHDHVHQWIVCLSQFEETTLFWYKIDRPSHLGSMTSYNNHIRQDSLSSVDWILFCKSDKNLRRECWSSVKVLDDVFKSIIALLKSVLWHHCSKRNLLSLWLRKTSEIQATDKIEFKTVPSSARWNLIHPELAMWAALCCVLTTAPWSLVEHKPKHCP